MTRHFTIFGAGLAGALMAVLLARRGHRVELYERRPDPRKGTPERGRSINLALSTRGIEALRAAGLADLVLAEAIPMKGRMIHPAEPNPSLKLLPYSNDPTNHINSVSRWGLNLTLLSAAQAMSNVRVHFGVRCQQVDFDSGRAEVLDIQTGSTRWIDAAPIIGADGAFSGVRGSMQKRDRFDFSQSYLTHGYKELTIPPAPGGGWRIEKHALHIWPRGESMMIALPNNDGSFTCTLFWPLDGEHSFAALQTDQQVMDYFKTFLPDAVPLIPNLADDFRHNPTASLVTIRCAPWWVSSRAVLVGDAAHAVVPFYGQGMNASFEDCVELDARIAEHPTDLQEAFAAYGTCRKPNTDALADLAYENFIEMRHKVNGFLFRRRGALEKALARRLEGYRDLYERVTFSTEPYASTRRSVRAQNDRLIALLRDDAPRDHAVRQAVESTAAEVFRWFNPREADPAREARQRRALRRLLGEGPGGFNAAVRPR